EDEGAAVRPGVPSDSITVVVPPGESERRGLRDRLIAQLGGATRFFLPVLSSTLAVAAAIVLVLFLAIYLAIDPGLYRRGLVSMVPARSRPKADRVLTAIATTLRKWLVTQLIAMVVIGVVTTVALLALDVRAAVPLGILAGLLEFVPTLGPILSALPAIAMGFVDSPEKALAVTIAYIGIQFVENHVLIPILMKEGIDVPPALTIVMQAMMAIVFGFLGLLVAVPLLATFLIAARTLSGEQITQPPALGGRAMPTSGSEGAA
ncbi:MAG TPA: AI-2E family transporter, partial [Gemmatimonadaceae bacterium]|nr:AI-2E family transporter [Gemmatimonadaceae bacterium]